MKIINISVNPTTIPQRVKENIVAEPKSNIYNKYAEIKDLRAFHQPFCGACQKAEIVRPDVTEIISDGFTYMPYSTYMDRINKARSSQKYQSILHQEEKLANMIIYKRSEAPDNPTQEEQRATIERIRREIEQVDKRLKDEKKKQKKIALERQSADKQARLNSSRMNIESIELRRQKLIKNIVKEEFTLLTFLERREKQKSMIASLPEKGKEAITEEAICKFYNDLSVTKSKYLQSQQMSIQTTKRGRRITNGEKEWIDRYMGHYFENIAGYEVEKTVIPQIAKRLGLTPEEAKEQLVHIRNYRNCNIAEFDSMVLRVNKNNPEVPAQVVGIVESKLRAYDIPIGFEKRKRDFYILSGNLGESAEYKELSDSFCNSTATDNDGNTYKLTADSFRELDPVKNPNWMSNLYFVTSYTRPSSVKIPSFFIHTELKHYLANCNSFKVTDPVFDIYNTPELQDNIIIIKGKNNGESFEDAMQTYMIGEMRKNTI